ncbi:MAG: LamG domain-containing protein [Planctomycetes bacterium]|nr:LamG domain-containing protein [Planctomycetota bacterium]MBL7143228.1 LamG domain-containing protein [Phycisphaerae bacterium]
MPQLKPIRGKFLPKPDGSPEGRLIASLTGCWLMNEGTGDRVFDFSGNGNPGNITGATWGSGKFGSALKYDGTSDEVNFGDVLDNIFTAGFTFSFWLNVSSNTGSPVRYILNKSNGLSSGGGFMLAQSGTSLGQNKIGIWLLDGSAPSPSFLTSATLPLNQDVHLAATWDGTTASGSIKIYFNGVEQAGAESNYGTIPIPNNLDLRIGPEDGGTLTVTGTVDNLNIFNRALSASEITLLYREPFCMFAGAGRSPLIGGQIINLAGASAGLSSLSATAKTIRKTKGTITGFTAVNGLLSVTGESPQDMEMSRLREALFNGMTANAFKLGTVLSLGWFWARISGCSALYRGYNMEEINFEDILAVAEQDDCEISPPGYISHSSGSTYFYIIRRFNSCGYQERTLAAAIKFSIESNGEAAEPKPNKVFDSIYELKDGNKIRLIWFYCPLEQKSKPVCFNVYYDSRTGQIDYQNPLAKIDYKGRKFYSFQSGSLEAGKYLFAIRAEDSGGLENNSLAQLNIQLDSININAINILRAEAV